MCSQSTARQGGIKPLLLVAVVALGALMLGSLVDGVPGRIVDGLALTRSPPTPAGPNALEGVLALPGPSRVGPRGEGIQSGGPLWVDVASSGRPWRDLGTIDGLLTFRGNPTRSFYGRGPVPSDPAVVWQQEIGCANSPVSGQPKVWCGTGWTGQPVVFPSPKNDGRWWVAVGGYNRAVNFFDAETGDEAFPAYETEDIIKGTVTVDPDGFPLLYTGSRDDRFHIVALDRETPEALWELSAVDEAPTLWNNDWDSSAVVLDDYLFVGGENSRFYGVKLNRSIGSDGRVSVRPAVAFSVAGWDDELLAALGDRAVSIEGSVAVAGSVAYFANSGGLVQGWDLSAVAGGGQPSRVFRFWIGDDTDASVVIDEAGMLYAAAQYERENARSDEIGQVVKLDPSRPDDPLVWSKAIEVGLDTGVWATPALYKGVVIVATDDGRVLGLDRETGEEAWGLSLPTSLWSSPVVVDDVLVQPGCDGVIRGFQFDRDQAGALREPELAWSATVGGCVESTAAVWDGFIYVGSRDGNFYALAD